MSYTRRLAAFAATLRLSDVPEDVRARAKSIILDGLGCGLFGAKLEWTRILAEVSDELDGGGKSALWGLGRTASPVNAALVNGTMIQGYELDDANPASIHSCAAVLPAAIAACEHVGAGKVTGERLLTAIIAGFEVGPRVGLCLNGNKMLVRGWHTPGIFGPFPAAAAAGIILGLDETQMHHAFGIAAPQASGLMAAQFGSMVKRMLSAKAAQSGLYAALLAAKGFTGVEDVFEQKYGGYCTTFTQTPDQFDLGQLTDGLGDKWETMRISIKRHASVGTNLAALDAVEAMMREDGLKADQVDSILVKLTEDGVAHSFWRPYVPAGLTAAQMHLGFCIAMQLIDGEVFVDHMIEENVGRPDLLAFCEKVDVVRDPARETKGRQFARGADVEVRLKNGKRLSRTVDNFLGSYQKPMSDEAMAVKYRRLAAKTVSEAGVIRLENWVRRCEAASDVSSLIDLLASGREASSAVAASGSGANLFAPGR